MIGLYHDPTKNATYSAPSVKRIAFFLLIMPVFVMMNLQTAIFRFKKSMNKRYYQFGNPFKVKFRKHFCYRCGTKLSTEKHHKVVSQKSEEAKYYDFDAGGDGGVMVGSFEFIHKVFYCPTCFKQIEFVTQLSFEDIDIFIEKLKHRFLKKGIILEIKKTFETKEETCLDKADKLEDIKYLCLTGYKDDKALFLYRFPLLRQNSWERPYYFKIKAKKFIKSIEKQEFFIDESR